MCASQTKLRRFRALGFVTSILLILNTAIAPAPAQSFSNTGVLDLGQAQLFIEDVALCTKYNYNYDAPIIWSQTGYETCPSENLTESALPASLHFKVRIQTKSYVDFYPSSVSAYVIDQKGTKLALPRWSATPLVNIDGPVNLRDTVFYGAFSLPDVQTTPAGYYAVLIQIWNGQWNKLNGPNVEEKPTEAYLTKFVITTSQKLDNAPNAINPANCEIEPAAFVAVQSAANSIVSIKSKVQTIKDLTTPGLVDALSQSLVSVKTLYSKAQSTISAIASKYKGKAECLTSFSNFMDLSDSLYSQFESTAALLDGLINKADAYAAKNQDIQSPEVDSSNCLNQSNIAILSLKKSDAIFSKYQSGMNSRSNSGTTYTTEVMTSWLNAIKLENQNVAAWNVKLPEYIKMYPDCVAYKTAFNLAQDVSSRYSDLVALISDGINEMSKNQGQMNSTNENSLQEEDGVEEEPEASLSVLFSSSTNRYILKVESNLPNDTLTVRATKKGARAIRFTIDTDDDGAGGLKTKTKLSGYTLALMYNGERLDSIRVK